MERQPTDRTADQSMSGSANAKLVADRVAIDYRIKSTGEVFRAVEDISLRVSECAFVCIVGPSGCGKSSFLNVVAGLQPYGSGDLRLDGRAITGPGDDRAVVFQQAALLPWRTTLRNVTYGLELRGVPKDGARSRAQDMIDLVGLSGNEGRYPYELSGGMQQRVNLARALAVDPELLLLDEPFAALDAQTREVMQQELLRIWGEAKKTALFVTHQIDEAVFLADQVVVLTRGPASRVAACLEVPLSRPRKTAMRRSREFLDLVDEVWGLVGGE